MVLKKIRAAHECGCQVIAIKRPKEHDYEEDEHGKSLEEIKQWLSKEKHRKKNAEHPQESAEYIQKTIEYIQKTTENLQKTKEHLPEITLLGIGTGGTGQITLNGLQAILRADAFLGASRMIETAKTMRRMLSGSKSIPPVPRAFRLTVSGNLSLNVLPIKTFSLTPDRNLPLNALLIKRKKCFPG